MLQHGRNYDLLFAYSKMFYGDVKAVVFVICYRCIGFIYKKNISVACCKYFLLVYKYTRE